MPVAARVTLQKKGHMVDTTLTSFSPNHSFCSLRWIAHKPACVLLLPEWQQDTVADEDSQAPEDSEPQTYMTEVVVASSQ